METKVYHFAVFVYCMVNLIHSYMPLYKKSHEHVYEL